MASYDYGKLDVVHWIRRNFYQQSTCLDVGACDGKWADLLGGWLDIDACEIFAPNIWMHNLRGKYRRVYNLDINELMYNHYDLIIFGDVLEHMTVEDAQRAVEYARPRCKDMIIGVPWRYKQGELYGNKWERHIQDDLTPELFDERYPGFEILVDPGHNYAYYHLAR